MTRAPHERVRRLEDARLYLILTLRAEPESAWRSVVEDVLATGAVDLFQLRDRGEDEGRLRERAHALVPRCASHGVLFVLNDRPDLVAALRADGAHVGQEDVPAAQARRAIGGDRLLGLSTHGAREVAAARRLPVDYIGLGPCFATDSKRLARKPGGPALVAACAPHLGTLPCFAIGGITRENAPVLIRAGARRLACGAGILAAADPPAAARDLAAMLGKP